MKRLILGSVSTVFALSLGAVAQAGTPTTTMPQTGNQDAQTSSPTDGIIAPSDNRPGNRVEPGSPPADLEGTPGPTPMEGSGVNADDTIIAPTENRPNNRVNPAPGAVDGADDSFYSPEDADMGSETVDPSETIISPNDNSPVNRVDPSADTLGDGPRGS